MQPASPETVLGDFADTAFQYGNVTSRFWRKNGQFMVRTDGPDGTLHDYEITHTFGVDPLQQYLITFPDGRLQALSIAWDTRPAAQGGQRWFHLYPGEQITHRDPLHWTGMYQNWNFMCADCHSTHLQRNYDADTDRYATTWSEISVGCEACHGPGARHVAWATNPTREQEDPKRGLSLQLNERQDVVWIPDPVAGTARRSQPRQTTIELETCGRCHARRSRIAAHDAAGEPLLDSYRLQLLTAGAYHADGQIRDEVYEYGSFLQSKMHAAGVTCSDCHDPHTLKPRAAGNALCSQCHMATRFDTPAHHFHAPDSQGARCVACHAPATTYMGVDARRDHSFRIPRPDLSLRLGTPNACTGCHTDQTATWAVEQLQHRRGKRPQRFQTYAEALHAARVGHPAAERMLAGVVRDASTPHIARATALWELSRYPSPTTLALVEQSVTEPTPLVRVAAGAVLQAFPPAERLRLGVRLLDDPLRAIRLEAVWALADIAPSTMPESQRERVKRGLAEYVRAQEAQAERPESQVNLGTLHMRQGRFPEAEAAYRKAMTLQPSFVGAHINLADLYRRTGRDGEGEQVLHAGIALVSDSADLHHALGLLLVRQRRYDQALEALARAVRLAPDNAHYATVYAVALSDLGQPEAALAALQAAQARQPHNAQVLLGLVQLSGNTGRLESALRYAEQLAQLDPMNASFHNLVRQLRAAPAPGAR